MVWHSRWWYSTTCDNSLKGTVKETISQLCLTTFEYLETAIRECFNGFYPSTWKISRRRRGEVEIFVENEREREREHTNGWLLINMHMDLWSRFSELEARLWVVLPGILNENIRNIKSPLEAFEMSKYVLVTASSDQKTSQISCSILKSWWDEEWCWRNPDCCDLKNYSDLRWRFGLDQCWSLLSVHVRLAERRFSGNNMASPGLWNMILVFSKLQERKVCWRMHEMYVVCRLM